MPKGTSEDRARWICASCGERHAEHNLPCTSCAGEEFARLEDSDDRVDAAASITWVCQECGETAPKNNSPCRVCGSLDYEAVDATEVQDEWSGVTNEPSEATATGGGNARLYGNIAFVACMFIPALQFFAPLLGGWVAGYLQNQGKSIGKSLGYQIGMQWAKGTFILGLLIGILVLVLISPADLGGLVVLAFAGFVGLVVFAGIIGLWTIGFATLGGALGGSMAE